MKKYSILIVFLCLLGICFLKKTNEIQVSYLEYSVETPYDISIVDLKKMFEKDSVQKVCIPQKDISYIIKNIKGTKKKKKFISEPRMVIK